MGVRRRILLVLMAVVPLLPHLPGRGGAAAEAMEGRVVLAKAADVELGAEPVRVPFSNLELASRLDTLGPRHLYLVLRGLRASRQPGVLYHLYLNLPAGAAPASDDPRHVGTINFYAAGPGNSDPERIFYSADITETARTLRARNLLRDPMTVTVYPSGSPEAKVMISRIELIEE